MQLSFTNRVLRIVKKIPKGSVLTYQEVARRAGNPRAARAVGNIMKQNYDSTIPCHRVIRSNGQLGEYNQGRLAKHEKLVAEGYQASNL